MSEHTRPDEGGTATGEGGPATDAEASSAPRTRPWAPRRAPGAWRLTTAVLLAGALAWAAAGSDGTWGVQPGRGDGTSVTTAPAASFVRSAALACPGWPGERPDGALPVLVRAATAPAELGGPAGVGDGATLAAPEDGSTVRFPSGGRLDAIDVDGAWSTAAGGPDAAPGLVAAQLTLSAEQGSRGLALAPCRAPAEVVRLLGGAAGAGRVEQLVVTNPGADPVTVTVEVNGPDGPVEVTGGSGLVVPARGRTAYLLDALAPGAGSPAVTVRADDGTVSAHLVERQREGSVDLGTEVVPAAGEGRDLVVPALPPPVPGEDRSLTLRLFAPQEEAVVELRALTPDGVRTPSEPVVRVPAGSTVEVDLAGLDDDAVALRLRSDTPVVAAARLALAPSSDEPVVVEEGPADDASTRGPDGASATTGPDGAGRTTSPDDAAGTASPEDAAATSAPDDSAATASPDDATVTSAPDDAAATADPRPRQRVVRPAGETAWVTAVPLASSPVGAALPGAEATRPAGEDATLALAVSVVDATRAEVLWLTDDGSVVVEELQLGNDTTALLDVPREAAAVWVRPVGGGGVAAALHLRGSDDVGPYLGAATLPGVPWTRVPTQVLPALP